MIREEFPDELLVYLMGGDSLSDLPIDWHAPAEFVAACDELGVMRRPNDAVDKIKSIPNILILNSKGGEGAVREFVNKIL